MATTERLAQLRLLLKKHKITAYIIPTDDAHQSEYIADCDKRRVFISGFTGSAGVVVVTAEQALLWTDGRYHLQASQQLDSNWTLMRKGTADVPTMEEWLGKELPSDARIGFDPYLTSGELHKKYSEALECLVQTLVPMATNLVDEVWAERPPRPCNALMTLPVKYSGRSWEDKVEDVRAELKKKGVAFLVVTALDEVAWLFNVRGSDISYNPVFFAYAIVTLTDVRLFIDEARLTPELRSHLSVGVGVTVCPYTDVANHISDLLQEREDKAWVSSKSSHALCSLVPAPRRVSALSPVQLLKAVKNETETQGMRNAHVRDAAAVCEYLAWLEKEVPKGYLTEITAADKLESLRKEQPDFVSLSFPTISGSGPNGAVIHYNPTPQTDRKLSAEELYLCDSGAQYRDGTTDITRTVHFGSPTDKQKECFTRVLKGHIALCTAVFPNKTHGHRIECLARHPLWTAGLDYRHGTGHGVGAFLNVHEGPQGISLRQYPEPLQAGMFVSDEPGYYEDGSFGVRIENVVYIKPVETKYNFGNTGFLTMEPVTLVPIQSKMIIPSLLTQEEIEWLNSYHALCLERVGEYLASSGRTEALRWLHEQTQALG